MQTSRLALVLDSREPVSLDLLLEKKGVRPLRQHLSKAMSFGPW